MKYLNTNEIAIKWNISERSVRNYCSQGRVVGAILNGKKWLIPEIANKPIRNYKHNTRSRTLLEILKDEKESKLSGGIYHKLQVEMTYNSNHIEGSKLSHEQTRYIFETRTIYALDGTVNVDDVIETSNHFRCIDFAIDSAKYKLNESLIKQFHYILKQGTEDSRKQWFKCGDYKTMENEVGGTETTTPKLVKKEMKELIDYYNKIEKVTIEDIIDFHYRFEKIHPFQDGNGRVGRLIMLKECLKNNLVPIIINDDFKLFYYRGLKEYPFEKGYLIDTCLFGQDIMKNYLQKYKIK